MEPPRRAATFLYVICMSFQPTFQHDRALEFNIYEGRQNAGDALLFSADVATAAECSVMCLNHPLCFSFNIGREEDSAKLKCQGIHNLVNETGLTPRENFAFYSLPFPLSCQGIRNTSCYVVDQGKVTQPEAKAACANLSADACLVVMETEEESTFVCDIVAKAYMDAGNVTGTKCYYIGLELNELSGTYSWLHSSEELQYFHWVASDPDQRPGEYAVGIWRDWRGWVDVYGSLTGGYVCEVKIRSD